MVVFRRSDVLRIDDEDDLSPVIGPLQLAAAAIPAQRITDLVGPLLDPDCAPVAIAASFQTNGARKARR
jgi:hypothetical protein